MFSGDRERTIRGVEVWQTSRAERSRGCPGSSCRIRWRSCGGGCRRLSRWDSALTGTHESFFVLSKSISFNNLSIEYHWHLLIQVHVDRGHTSGGAAPRGLFPRVVQGHQHELRQGTHLHRHQLQHLRLCRAQTPEGRAGRRLSCGPQEASQVSPVTSKTASTVILEVRTLGLSGVVPT